MNIAETSTRIAIKNILFATDFGPCSNAALPYALAISRQYEAKMYAAHVLAPDTYLFATAETWPELVEQQQEQQQRYTARLEEQLQGVPHTVMTPVGDVWDVLFRLVQDYDIDLMVLGTHGRTGLRKLLLGSVAERIFRRASCPVLTVGPNVVQRGAGQFKRILFATDFSEESLAAAPYAFSLAEEQQAQLSLLNVLERPETGAVVLESNTDFVIRRLQDLVPPETHLWCQANYCVEFGLPQEQILQFTAKHSTDLIVLGVRAAHGPVGDSSHLGHTTAQHIVAHADCPVLTVRG